MTIPRLGVANLRLGRHSNVGGSCALCAAPITPTDQVYIFTMEYDEEHEEYIPLHDSCFFHMVFVIREFFDKNGVEIPEVLRGYKRDEPRN